MEPQVQYAKTSDGVSIAYYAVGNGEPLVVLTPLGPSHLTMERRWSALTNWYDHISEHRTLVRLDFRNSGLSDRKVADISEEALDRDIEAVCGQLGFESVDVLACVGGCFSALGLAARKPERVRRLLLVAALLRFSDYFPGPEGKAVLALVEQDWNLFVQTASHARLGWSSRESHDFAVLWRESCLQEDYIRLIAEGISYDVSPLLDRVRARTLVLYPAMSAFARHYMRAARAIASTIPDSGVVEWSDVPNGWLENSQPLAAIDEFLGIPAAPVASGEKTRPSGTVIILFADIVDSTALTERLGDAAFRDKARELDETLRKTIRDNAGTPIEGKLLGDGVLATFTSARRAIEAALACGKAGDGGGLPLHLGLHAGDVIREEDNVYGGAVNIAARISGLSAPGEVLVSETVRSLARTSAGVSFEDRGEQTLKGVGEAVRVWAVVEGEV